MNRGSRKSDKLMEKLLKSTEAQSKAELHKNTLLEYDKTSEKRTKVIDDESDYFATDTGKSLSEALSFASTNPQYVDRLFFESKFRFFKKATKFETISHLILHY